MAGAKAVRFWSVVERHHPNLPRYAIVPARLVAPWRLDGTTVIRGMLNDTSLGRRSLKRFDEERWFIDLPQSLCARAGVDTGDRIRLEIRVAATTLPKELTRLMARSSAAKRRWERLTASRQRMVREHVAAAKRSETRERRARRALGLDGEH